MASRVIKEDRSEGLFKMREFATVERGEKDYSIRSFADDEELSIQDMFSDTGEEEPETVTEYEDEVTDKDYWPPSRLVKAEEGIVGEKVDLPTGKIGQGFVESPMFSDEINSDNFVEEPQSASIIRSRDTERAEDDLPLEDIPVMQLVKNDNNDNEYGQNILLDEDYSNNSYNANISESELESLKKELESYKEQIDGYKAHAEEMEALKLTVEKALMERDKQLETANNELTTLKESLPEQLEASKQEGRNEGYEEAKVEFQKVYEAEKADYLAKLDNFYKDANIKLNEIKTSIDAMDEQIPSTVIGFVKTLIGEERKINDSFALNIIKQNLSRLHEFRDIKFKVNPEDLEITQSGLKDYQVTSDISIPKGAVIVDSKSGEIALNVDTMINDLEKEINAQLATLNDSQAKN